MPSRAFLVSPFTKEACSGQVLPRLSQCPRGHSWFLHLGACVMHSRVFTSVSMPSRAFLVSPSDLPGAGRARRRVSMPSRAFLVSPLVHAIVTTDKGYRVGLNALAGILGFSILRLGESRPPGCCLNALAGILGFSIGLRAAAGAQVRGGKSQCPRGHSWFLHSIEWTPSNTGCHIVSMPSRAFLVSPFEIKQQRKGAERSQCPRGHSWFLHTISVTILRHPPCESQCPRGHSWFLHFCITRARHPGERGVSMPSRAFLVSPSVFLIVIAIVAMTSQCPRGHSWFLHAGGPGRGHVGPSLNALAGILGFSMRHRAIRSR